MARRDPHSYNDDTQVATAVLALTARIDFASRILHGDATLTFHQPGAGTLDLDTRDLAIDAVEDGGGQPLPFTLHPSEPVLGARLAIELRPGTAAVRIRYRTAPTASALQWLEPAQTAGGVQPFLFSQSQAIHARSMIPLQDTPR
nr:M1 family peptidase [Deltaproteobacteria bacterium]